MNKMQVGFARVCITPPLGVPMDGYYTKRAAEGILDDLYASAVVFDDGEHKAVIMSVDHLGLGLKYSLHYRNMIAAFCDIPLEAIFMACTHTHTGPLVGESIIRKECGIQAYEEHLGLLLRDCVSFAMSDLKPAKLSVAEGHADGVSFIRRYLMKDGSIRFNPPIGDPDIVAQHGEPHKTVYLIRIDRENAETIYLVNFSVHADAIGGNLISADWPGFVVRTMEGALENSKCMFLTGFQGDVGCTDRSPIKGDWDVRRGYRYAAHIGKTIAGAALAVSEKTRPTNAEKINFAQRTVQIPANKENDRLDWARKVEHNYRTLGADYYNQNPGKVPEALRILQLEKMPDFFDFTLSAVRIGDIVFGGIPGEPFTEIGNRIRQASPFPMTVLCCQTNGAGTYFPSSEAYNHDTYENLTARVKKGSDDILVQNLTQMIHNLQ